MTSINKISRDEWFLTLTESFPWWDRVNSNTIQVYIQKNTYSEVNDFFKGLGACIVDRKDDRINGKYILHVREPKGILNK